jgi:PAS domain S-box-containing protein
VNQPSTIDLLGRLDAVVFEADADNLHVTFAAGGALALLGLRADDFTSDPELLTKRLHPDDREPVLALLRAVGEDGRERRIEHRMISSDGDERWFRTEVHRVAGERAASILGLMIDATDARRTAEALRTAESRLRQVINNVPMVLFATDRDGTVTLSEGSGLRALGLGPGELIGRNIFQVYAGLHEVHAVMRRALAGEALTSTFEALGIWWETRWSPLYDDTGALAGVTTVALNITKRKRAEDELARSISVLRATFEATNDGILVIDRAGRFIDYNRRFGELWRVPEEILLARDDVAAFAVALSQLRDPDAFASKVGALIADPDAVSHDVLQLRDGRMLERDSRPLVVGGASVGRVWSFRDVTSERRAIRRATFLAAASKVLAGPLEDVTPLDAIARMTVPWLCDWCNILLVGDDGEVRSAAAYHHDSSKIELLRKLYPDMRRRDRGVARVITTGEPLLDNGISDVQLAGPMEGIAISVGRREQIDILRSLGLRGRLAVPLRARGQIIGAIAFASGDPERVYDVEDLTLAMDLAQRAALAIDNQRLYQASKQAVALRDEFLSVASHELRTPMTSLQLAVQSALSIGRDAPPDFLRHALESAQRQTRRVGRLVDALLDVSRLEAGNLELRREPTDLGALVRDVMSMLADDARRAGCDLRIEAEADVFGNWDRTRLEQVVTNLISNAIKYAAGKPIRISVQKAAGGARLVVRDQGLGVAAADRARIFERFERAVSARHYGGLGLGLYIVRRIVEAHGGDITVENVDGNGAQFAVTLPLQ